MHTQASEPRASDDSRLQRAIVSELLSDGDEQQRSLAELGERLQAEVADLEVAVSALCAAGVLEREESLAWASVATRRLDELDLIAI